MADDLVRLECKITGDFQVVITQDQYNAWAENGDKKLLEQVRDAIGQGFEEARSDLETVVDRAVLVEDDGYLGTDIVTLKKF